MLKLILGLLLLSSATCFAGEPTIAAFSATYKLYKGESEVGESELSMQLSDRRVRWQLSSRATGIYAILSNKKPYSESILKRAGDSYQLASIQVSDDGKDKPEESALFDWQKKTIEVERKGKSRVLDLGNAVFDYLSIHWFSAQMTLDATKQSTVAFYRKGKLVKSTLKLIGVSEVNLGSQTRSLRLYEQSFENSKTRYHYYYDLQNPSLPIKIERIKPGKDNTTLIFNQFNPA